MSEDSSSLLRFPGGGIVDYTTLRIRAREAAIHYYGAAGGGPWTGYQGSPTLLLSLAAAGNISALAEMEGLISVQLGESIRARLAELHDAIRRELDPF